MTLNFSFFFTNLMLGVGLAMDAFSVSLANGLNEPQMCIKKSVLISGIFAVFQAIMPLIGWVCVHTIIKWFTILETFIPYIALILLSPIFLIVSIMIKADSKGPVFFLQKRIGLNGKMFKLYKFRSMVPNADEMLKELLKQKEYKEEWDKNQKLEKYMKSNQLVKRYLLKVG